MSQNTFDTCTIKNLPGSQVEITASVSAEQFSSYKKKALSKLGESISIDGFRKGKVPEDMLISKVGNEAVLYEMADFAIRDAYPAIVADKKIDALGSPQVTITKIAEGSPLEFKATTLIMPEVTLPDYKKIAQDVIAQKGDTEVTEDEYKQTIKRIQEIHAPKPAEGEKKDTEAKLPEITDEFVKTLGDFTDVSDFEDKVRGGLKKEKEIQAREKKRLAMVEKIVEETKVDMPEVFVDSELQKLYATFVDNVTRSGMTVEAYLENAKKTEEEIKTSMKPDAEKRAKLHLALGAISKKESISADPKRVEEETQHLLEHHKNADPERARLYVLNALTNEAVFRFLEEIK
ncbi:MAG: trigger factor [Candidatus Paceibacterota bacterium]